MLIRFPNANEVFHGLIKRVFKGKPNSFVLLLVNKSVDSVCAGLLLTQFLSNSDIQSVISVIEAVKTIKDDIDELFDQFKEINMIAFLDLGSSEPILDMLPDRAKDKTVVVIDSHRPVHHSLLDITNTDVYYFDSPETLFDQIVKLPRPDTVNSKAIRVESKKARLLNIEDLPKTSSRSQPCSFQVFNLIRSRSKNLIDLGVFAITGITSLYFDRMLSQDDFLTYFDKIVHSVSEKDEELLFVSTEEGSYMPNPNVAPKKIEELSFKPIIDLRLAFLYDNSIIESFFITPLMISTLGLWSNTGIERLNQLLTRMDITPSLRKTNFQELPEEIKASLPTRFDQVCDTFNLGHGIFPSLVFSKDGQEATLGNLIDTLDYLIENARSDLSAFDNVLEQMTNFEFMDIIKEHSASAKKLLSEVAEVSMNLLQRKSYRFLDSGYFKVSVVNGCMLGSLPRISSMLFSSSLRADDEECPVLVCQKTENDYLIAVSPPYSQKFADDLKIAGESGYIDIIFTCTGHIECEVPVDLIGEFLDRLRFLCDLPRNC